MRTVTVRSDVTDAVGLGEPLETVTTVYLPEHVATRPTTICFALPGGGYSRRYFEVDVYEPRSGGQAGWHVDHGWIFAASDYLNAGESSHAADPGQLTYEHLAAAGHATVRHIVDQLRSGTLSPDFPALGDLFTIGIGQSLGAGILVVQQGQLHTFDAVAILGFSARRTMLWMPPGQAASQRTYIPRGVNVAALTPEVHHAAIPEMASDADGIPLAAPGFHYDDVPREVVVADLVEYPARRGQMPEWGTATMPPCAMTMMSPGAISTEAAMIRCPVFVGLGERDTCPEPLAEPSAYRESTDISLFICPNMAHMHNFASSRKKLWARLHAWGEAVAG